MYFAYRCRSAPLSIAERRIRDAATTQDIRRAAELERQARNILGNASAQGWSGDIEGTVAEYWAKYGYCND